MWVPNYYLPALNSLYSSVLRVVMAYFEVRRHVFAGCAATGGPASPIHLKDSYTSGKPTRCASNTSPTTTDGIRQCGNMTRLQELAKSLHYELLGDTQRSLSRSAPGPPAVSRTSNIRYRSTNAYLRRGVTSLRSEPTSLFRTSDPVSDARIVSTITTCEGTEP